MLIYLLGYNPTSLVVEKTSICAMLSIRVNDEVLKSLKQIWMKIQSKTKASQLRLNFYFSTKKP